MDNPIAVCRSQADRDVEEPAVYCQVGLFGADIGNRTVNIHIAALHDARSDQGNVAAAVVESVDLSAGGNFYPRIAVGDAAKTDFSTGTEESGACVYIIAGQDQAADIEPTCGAGDDAAGTVEPYIAAARGSASVDETLDGPVELYRPAVCCRDWQYAVKHGVVQAIGNKAKRSAAGQNVDRIVDQTVAVKSRRIRVQRRPVYHHLALRYLHLIQIGRPRT